MTNRRKIDHIVYAVPHLENAMNWFENISGVRPVFGGYHANQGTKNALVNLGDGCYLELIAIDEKNTKVTAPRWMGVDLLKGQGCITRWSLKSDTLVYDSGVIKAYHPAMGVIHKGQRKTTSGNLLSWQMSLPLSEPLVELVPFFTDWQTSEFHPTDQLPQTCELTELILIHPEPESIAPTIHAFWPNYAIKKGEHPGIKAKLNTPKGVLVI